MEDETGALNADPREAWQYLWDTLTTRDQKETAIIEAQALLRTKYDPDKPITATFKILQNAKHLLQRMKPPLTDKDLIRNFVYSLGKHGDYSRGIREWNKKCKENSNKDPPVTNTWKKCKIHFTKYRVELENDPSTKKALNIANTVTEQVQQNAADTKVAAQAALENDQTIALLKAEIAALKVGKENNKNAANQVTTTDPQVEMMKILMQTMNTCITNNKNGTGGGRKGGKNGRDVSNIPLHKRPNDLGDGKRSFKRYPDTHGYCWSCGYDVHLKHKCGPRSRKLGHKNKATVTNLMGGSERNMHLYNP